MIAQVISFDQVINAPTAHPAPRAASGERSEERVRMSKRRATIARRLVEAQSTAAMLSTFNEVDMSAVMALRERRKQAFKDKHGVNLGLSSFFVKAAIGALKEIPRVNSELQGDEMVLKQYYDIGVAVGAAEGLVVPVLRDADRMSFAEVEQQEVGALVKRQQGPDLVGLHARHQSSWRASPQSSELLGNYTR